MLLLILAYFSTELKKVGLYSYKVGDFSYLPTELKIYLNVCHSKIILYIQWLNYYTEWTEKCCCIASA